MVCEGGGHAQKSRAVSAMDVTVNVFRGLLGSEDRLVASARLEDGGILGKAYDGPSALHDTCA